MSLKDEIRQAIANETEQRSESWLQMRLGKFTGSQIYRLMANVKRPMTEQELANRAKGSKATTIEDVNILSDGAITYIEENIGEIWTGQSPHDFWSAATSWGEDNEGYAREEFEKRMGVKILLNGHNIWKEYPNEAGGSSDGHVEGQDAIIEIKCPLNSGIHVKYSRMTSPIDLPTEYYWQMQSNMMFAEKSLCYFISYDPRVKKESARMKILEVPAENRAQDLIRLKLKLAIEKKAEILNHLDNQAR